MSTCLAIPKPQPLGAARELFSRFNRTGIRYCHFKSKEHPSAGLSGHTDLDMRATQLRPDLVIKLDLPEVAARRTPEMTVEELGRRRQAARASDYGESSRIDASAPLEKVLLAVKRAIREKL